MQMAEEAGGRVLVEICVDTIASAAAALHGGAHRLELCASLAEGGITPSHALIQAVVRLASACTPRVPVYVMIRPRAGDFVYTPEELSVMREDICNAAALGAAGAVFGCLCPDGTVDEQQTRELMRACREANLDATFHRAFDVATDPTRALETLIALGVPRVLTSGQEETALAGADLIRTLRQQASGRIAIMAGAGVGPGNVREILGRTGVREVHASARNRVMTVSNDVRVAPRATRVRFPGMEEGLPTTCAETVAALIKETELEGSGHRTDYV
eukprot:jgi/Chlat1/5152/Chrsp33S05144